MRDLTQGKVALHILRLATPIGIGMLVQTLYYLIDLYFVGQLGKISLAAVSASGNAAFVVLGLTQILGVGTVALISQSVGRKQQSQANQFFNQSWSLALMMGMLVFVAGYLLGNAYLSTIINDQATLELGNTYLDYFIPGLALQFALVATGSALRGTGIVKPTMIVQLLSLLLNIILTPVLIAGWGTGHAMGVAGAALASSISVAFAVILMVIYFVKLENYVQIDIRQAIPRWRHWRRIFGIGLPAGGEFLLMFFYMAVIYWAIQGFGPAAQAGFGLGSRVMQCVFLPAMALAFALPSMIGQNFGAGHVARVKESFRVTVIMVSAIMFVLTILCQWVSSFLILPFSEDPAVLTIAEDFLKLISLNFIWSGLIFTCSGVFQGLGNTLPALLSTASRFFLFALPVIWVSRWPDFEIEWVWYFSVATVFIQSLVSLWLVKNEFRKRLQFNEETTAPV